MMNSVLEYLEMTAQRVPERTAFCDDSRSLTYAELLSRARAIGSCLAETVKPKGIVAMLMDGHSLDCVPAMMGILYSGCAYAPLDPATPAERLSVILEQMKPDGILVDEKGIRALSAVNVPLPDAVSCIDAAEHSVDMEKLDQIRGGCTPTDLLSVMYTSGSTGIPKGSVQSHASYIGYTEATIRVYGFDESVVFASQSPFFYANCIIDIYPPIAMGAKVYLLPANCLTFPKRFLECMRREHISELTMTPSSFLSLVDSLEPGCLPELKWGIMSGERMPWRPLKAWMDACPNAYFYNFYGSTEAFSVAVGRVSGQHTDEEVLPVGQPFREVTLVFLDEQGNACDPLTGGEMLVTSPWISGGYWRDEARSSAVFLEQDGRRYYRTGDIGRLNQQGELIVLGRRDTQIKHHGYRMEIGEVEAALRGLEGWKDGCVLFDNANDRLFCFWTGGLTEKELKNGLKSRLPRAMLPDCYVRLEQLPRTATTKLDRQSLRRQYMDI